MNIHEKYMQRCIELAKNGLGKVSPNPLVGAVIVYKGKIIGEGFHAAYGEPHAEVNAINNVKDKFLLKESTLYVSLEPCCHHGKTPPCTSLILEHQIKKVVIGSKDPNELVAGKGIQLLKENGVEVVEEVLKEKCDFLNRRFFTFHQKKRPYIILKWAESADCFMDIDRSSGKKGQFQISSEESKQFVHQLRANEDAILVGVNTIINDNPSLTVRDVVGKNPIRIVIDKELKAPENAILYNDGGRTIVFTIKEADSSNDNVKYVAIPFKEPIREILSCLYQENISSLIVEGGQKTLQTFINIQMLDELFILKSKYLYLKRGLKSPDISSFVAFQEYTYSKSDKDIIVNLFSLYN